jgi:hypothetical protein
LIAKPGHGAFNGGDNARVGGVTVRHEQDAWESGAVTRRLTAAP